jgi:hypothetical protein
MGMVEICSTRMRPVPIVRARVVRVVAATALVVLVGATPALAASAPPATPEPIAAQRLDCQPGQVDINSAPATQMVARLGLPLPVAQRVVAHREPLYLDVEDLLTVEGIGPGKVDSLARGGVACADLPVTPPPVDAFVCRPGDGRVDVNRPTSRARLAALFGAPTADRIVAGIPYSGVKPMVAEHVPGVGSGKQAKLLDQLCDTPPTIDHAGTRWGWISTAGGRVDHPQSASLTVGPGIIDLNSGMWGSVRPLPYDSLYGGPKFDFQVHGPWAGGGDTVFATLPPDPFVPPAAPDVWRPTLLHYTGGDAAVHANDTLYVGPDGRWTTQVTSLSALQAVRQPAVSLPPVTYFTPVPRPEVGRALAKEIFGNPYEAEGCSPDASSERPLLVSVNPGFLATGGYGFPRAPAKWCAEGDASTEHMTFKLSNTGFPTFDYQQPAGPADTTGVGLSPQMGAFTRELLTLLNSGVKPGPDSRGVVYGPGVTVRYDLRASDDAQRVGLHRPSVAALGLDAVFLATEHLGTVRALDVPATISDCLNTLNRASLGLGSVLGCAEQALKEGKAPRRVVEAITRSLNAFTLFRDLNEVDALSDQSLDGTVTFRLRPHPEAPAGQPTSGDPNQAGTRILKRTGSTASYVLDTNGVAHHIPDGGTYICNAKHYLVQFNVDDSEWAAEVRSVGADATCPGGPERVLAENAPLGTVLLRRPSGETYLTRQLNGTTYLVPLFSGTSVFNCMVEQYLVWDQVTDAEYGRFAHHPFEAATGCGF